MKKQVKKSDFRRILPPGVQEDLVFGLLWIRFGNIKVVHGIKTSDRVSIQFWGEPTPAILEIGNKIPYSSDKRLQQYDIKCPITYFNRYLKDMSKNLQINVIGVGKVLFSIAKYIKPNLEIKDCFVFEPFKQFFPIQSKDKDKIGAIQIEMGTKFEPEIAIRQLGMQESSITQEMPIRKNSNEKPVQNVIKKQQKQPNKQIHYQESDEGNNSRNSNNQFYEQCKNALDVLALEDKEKMMNFYDEVMDKKQSPKKPKGSPRKQYYDNRIPNSLNLQPKPHNQFVAEKYNRIQQRKQQVIPQKSNNYHDEIKEEYDQSQIKKENIFPTINPVLTYSNLLMGHQQREDQYPKIITKKPSLNKSSSEQVQQKKIIESVQNQKYEIIAKPEIKDSFFRQFYGQSAGNPYKKEERPYSPQRQNYQKIKPTVERVVNLKEQFTKLPNNQIIDKRIYPPPQLQQQYTQRPIQTEHIITEKRNYSNLLLNMMVKVYTNTLQIGNLNKFMIGYRPYGQKERVKLGPNLKEIVSIMCPIGERELIQMANVPFIIEIWNPITNKFVGMVKVSLSKIYKGFILNGRINQLAIKTNLMPTVVVDQQVNIFDIKQDTIGSCYAFIAIGTASQIDAYQNSSRDQEKQKNINQIIPKNVEEPNQKIVPIPTNKQQIDKKPTQITEKASLQLFDEMLMFFEQNSETIFGKVTQIIEKPQQSITFLNFINQVNASAYTSLNFLFNQPTSQFLTRISECFNSFKAVQLKLQTSLSENIAIIKKKVKENTLKQLSMRSSFNVISKEKAFAILNSDLKNEKIINDLFLIFKENTINVATLLKIISGDIKAVNLHNLMNIQEINREIGQNITEWILKNNITSDGFMKIFGDVKCPINGDQVKIFLGKNNVQLSLWESLHLIDLVKKYFKEEDKNFYEISYIAMYNWLVKSEKSFIQKYNKNQIHNDENQINQSNASERKRQQLEKSREKSQEKHQKEENQQINQFLEQVQRNDSKPKIPQEKKQQKEVLKKIKHIFTIEPIQLSLSSALSGECTVSYNFPYQSQWISSKRFQIFNDKHKYSIRINGKHSFTINQGVEEYLGETHLKFRIKVDQKVIMVGAIHPDELIMSKNSSEVKIIPLYGDAEGMGGKIKMKIDYHQEEAKDENLGKQTTYNLFLPKSGYINYLIQSKADIYKIRQQLNIKQDFYLAIVLDLFWQSPNLKSHFPPISSKLHGDSNTPQLLMGNMKIALNPVFLEYFKHKTARLSLNVVYYSKAHANYQKQETTFGTLSLPLIQIMKNGIEGDYAFKNKLGMLAALVNCKMSYDKQIINHQPQQQLTNRRKDSYWVILHFLELINFQHRNPHSFKCEFVYQGKRHSTEKITLHGQTYHQLQDSSILLHLSEQDFMDFKVLPLSITLNHHEKLAVDIDIATFSRNMGRDKYAVGSQNFLIIDQHSKPVNMRLGAKVFIFRGNSLVGNFADALHRHLNHDFLAQMKMPAEIQHYDKMLNILRKTIKLNTTAFDDSIRELLPHKKDHFPVQFYAKQIYYKLDFTPIIANSDSQVDSLCQDLPSEVDPEELIRYVKANKISLINLRPQFLTRYSFGVLNKSGLDKNVSFLGLHSEVDLITFVRKLKMNTNDESELQVRNPSLINQSLQNNQSTNSKQLRITLVKGLHFSNLYNGIKPNAFIYLPQMQYRSNTFTRTSEPIIQESIREILNASNMSSLKKIKVEVYHQDEPQEILIGEGSFILSEALQKGGGERVVIDSIMSKKLQAIIQIRVSINDYNLDDQNYADEVSDVQPESDCSRIADIIRNRKEQMLDKEQLFRSSDQDDDY